ncbi:MAG: hypothetical protein HYU66_04545, partial [Armatimonadetes bacterium]|nr:hypothetical protein [Armatimonadota bacterium]
MPDITSIGGLPSQITNPALPGGLVGNAAARFGQVLQNTMQQGVAELQGDVAQQLGSASQAAAEGGRFTPLTSGPDGQVAELAHSVSAAVSNR